MEETPFVSIIIPVRNAERTLDKTFEYLLNAKYPRDKMELVIADGGSTDKTLDVIRQWQQKYPFIKLVEVPNCPSPGYARNKALDVVKGEFILFTDGDCAPCEEWITELLKPFYKDPKIGLVGGEIYTLKVDPNNLTEAYCEHSRFNMVASRYANKGEGYFPPLSDRSPSQICGHRAYFFVTANVAYRREVIEKDHLRFWDKPTGEDIEFGLKAQRAGWKLYFAPKAYVKHMHRANFKALKKVWVTYGQAHPPLMQAYASQVLEIVFRFITGRGGLLRIKIPFPLKGLIYVGNFHLMHLFGLLTLLGLILSWGIWTLIFLGLFLIFLFSFSYYCFQMKPHRYFFSWWWMKYMTNLKFIQGGLKGFWKYKAFCIEPSF